MNGSRELVELFADIAGRVHQGLRIRVTDSRGATSEIDCPPIRYIFGSDKTVKAFLDEATKTASGARSKLPMIALFTPVTETRGSDDYYSSSRVNLLIACATSRDWNNPQRDLYSFDGILRPIYRKLMAEIKKDPRVLCGYTQEIPHDYAENFSYGQFGAYTSNGERVTQPIDAIDIRELQLKIKPITCR
ncbi:MAG: hypothetical protein LIO91_08085 [Bacteroidales bacterium]|nr:hypothetical protein [Bacteroidales bacterium]